MTKSPNGLSTRIENQLKEQIADRAVHLAYAFDRIDFLIAASAPDLDFDRLNRHSRESRLLPHTDDFHPLWASELRVRQPHPSLPNVLKQVVGARYMLEVQGIEAACDVITASTEQALELHGLAVEHMMQNHSQRCILKSGTVCYFAGRNADVCLVIYADRPSKIYSPWVGHPCLHMELRIQHREGLARFGVHGVEDLANFDHLGAWEQATSFAIAPNKTAIGHLLRSGEGVSDDTALRAANEHLALHAIEGKPSLHNAVVANREIRKALQIISHQEIFGKPR